INVVARVPLCFGFLSGQHRSGAKFADGDQRNRWSNDQVERWIGAAEQFRFLERADRSLAQAALAFLLALGARVWAIPGMKTVAQAQENTAAADPARGLTAAEVTRCREVWRGLTHIPPR